MSAYLTTDDIRAHMGERAFNNLRAKVLAAIALDDARALTPGYTVELQPSSEARRRAFRRAAHAQLTRRRDP